MDKILDVPYCSQYLVGDSYWIIRSCGIACLKMILEFKGKDIPSLLDFAKESEKKGAYGLHGWIHNKLVEIACSYRVPMYREEKINLEDGILKIKNEIYQNKPVAISVIKRCLGQLKFHMVLITGVRVNDDKVRGFFFHEPEATTIEKGSNLFVDVADFKQDWRSMALFLR